MPEPDFSKRPEVTVSTMGKVHNPSGSGVPVKRSSSKNYDKATTTTTTATPSTTATSSTPSMPPNPHPHHHSKEGEEHATRVKEEGSSRRNITRKKSDGMAAGGNFDSRNKKQGGHGKGKWSESYDGSDSAGVPVLDKDDPLYDEELDAQGGYILSSGGGGGGGGEVVEGIINKNKNNNNNGEVVYGPMLTLPEFKLQVTEVLKEYFDSSDSDEVLRSIDEMKCRSYHSFIVKRAVSLSLDEGPRERELVSRLLTALHPSLLSDENVQDGFENLLDSLDDLTIDIPDARTMVGSFLARAVVDEVLAPIFLTDLNNTRAGDGVVEKAVSLLSHEHCAARLEHVWGPGDGRPVSELKTVMDQLLKEYLLSRELDEAARCVREMNAPNFHHELVKRGVVIAMEADGLKHSKGEEASSLDAMAAMFSFLVKNVIVSEHQVLKGLTRLRKILPDITLDIPGAPGMLDEFEAMANELDCLPKPK